MGEFYINDELNHQLKEPKELPSVILPNTLTNPRKWPTGFKYLVAGAVFILGCWLAGLAVN